MSFLEYEKNENLFVQAMKGTSLISMLRNLDAPARWAVLVPQSVILEELGIGVVSKDFLETHTVLFDDTAGEEAAFTTLNGLRGTLDTSSTEVATGKCDSVVVTLPAEAAARPATSTPLGPAASESPLTEEMAELEPGAAAATNVQTLHILRHTELLLDATDGFTIPIYLVSDAIRAKWLVGGGGIEKLGWFGEQTQQPREAVQQSPLQPQAQPATPEAEAETAAAPAAQTASPKSTVVIGEDAAKDEAGGAAAAAAAGGEAQRQQFRFRDFHRKLRGDQGLYASLKKFVNKVKAMKEEETTNLPAMVRDFLADMFEAINRSSVWKGATDQELDFAQEGIEKYVLTKIFSEAFSTKEDRANDEALEKRLESYKELVSPQNLEVAPEVMEHASWTAAVDELCKINDYKNPRDKLICVTNCCKLIFSVLHSLDPSKSMGADDFLPCLILLVGKAGVKQLHSNTTFILNYRHDSKMSCEAGYYFCTLQSAVHFWETADADSLQISQEALDEINAGLEGKERPDFNDVAIDVGDTWDLDKLGSTAYLNADGGPSPSGSTPNPSVSPDAGIDDFFATPAPAPKGQLPQQLRAILEENAASEPVRPLDSLQVDDLPYLISEYTRLHTLYRSVHELVHSSDPLPVAAL